MYLVYFHSLNQEDTTNNGVYFDIKFNFFPFAGPHWINVNALCHIIIFAINLASKLKVCSIETKSF